MQNWLGGFHPLPNNLYHIGFRTIDESGVNFARRDEGLVLDNVYPDRFNVPVTSGLIKRFQVRVSTSIFPPLH